MTIPQLQFKFLIQLIACKFFPPSAASKTEKFILLSVEKI